jgi:hypothetical protein
MMTPLASFQRTFFGHASFGLLLAGSWLRFTGELLLQMQALMMMCASWTVHTSKSTSRRQGRHSARRLRRSMQLLQLMLMT